MPRTLLYSSSSDGLSGCCYSWAMGHNAMVTRIAYISPNEVLHLFEFNMKKSSDGYVFNF